MAPGGLRWQLATRAKRGDAFHYLFLVNDHLGSRALGWPLVLCGIELVVDAYRGIGRTMAVEYPTESEAKVVEAAEKLMVETMARYDPSHDAFHGQ